MQSEFEISHSKKQITPRLPTTWAVRNLRSRTAPSSVRVDLKEFFNRSQFFWARLSCSGKPHAQDPTRRSNPRRDFIEAEIGVFDELSESRDQRPFSGGESQCLFPVL